MTIKEYRHPITFYFLATIIPWTFWFIAADISHISPATEWMAIVTTTLLIAGVCAPTVVAFWMIGLNSDLRRDIKNRFFNFRNIKPIYLYLTFFLMLASILLAQGISLLLGYSTDQFQIHLGGTFHGGVLPGVFWVLFAPIVEELAWHTYGTDCLRQRMNLLYTSLLFAFYWSWWHYPTFFIKGYYQSNLGQMAFIYSINFMISIIPFVILMNWLYYKSNRSIFVAIVFHLTAGFFNEIFNTHPDTKIIQTILLAILAVVIVIQDKKFFMQKVYQME